MFFCKIHKKTPVPEPLFRKVAGLYSATLLKEKTLTQVFSDELCKILRHFFYRTFPGDCFCSTENYFRNKIEKNPLGTENRKKKWKELVRKTT